MNKALNLFAQALAISTGVPLDDPYLREAAKGCYVAAGHLVQIPTVGFGSVRLFFENHHLAQPPLAFEITEGYPVELRGLIIWD